MDEIVTNSIVRDYNAGGFTTKNLWYYDAKNNDMKRNLCEDTFPCKPTWLDFSISQELHDYLKDYDLRYCLSFNENLHQEGLDKSSKENDPCLGFHDS